MMNEYVELLVLSYFRDHPVQYSLSELKEFIGVSFVQLEEILDDMLEQEKLFYEEAKLRLSFKGRIDLMNSNMEEYQNVSERDVQNVLLNNPWSIDKPFYVREFSKKKWRNC